MTNQKSQLMTVSAWSRNRTVNRCLLWAILFWIPVFIHPKPGHCQDLIALQKTKRIQFLTGYIQQKELNLIPKVHQGFQYAVEYQADRELNHLSRFQARLEFSPLTSPWETSGFSANLQIQAGYFHLFPILKNQNWKIWAGPFGNLAYNTSFYPNWDESHLYWANQLQTGVSSRTVYRLQGQARILFWEFNLPVIGLLSRPNIERDYKIDDFSFRGILQSMHHKPKLIGLSHNFQVHSRIGYNFPITQKKQAQFGYHFDHIQVSTNYSNQFIQSSHQIFIGINL